MLQLCSLIPHSLFTYSSPILYSCSPNYPPLYSLYPPIYPFFTHPSLNLQPSFTHYSSIRHSCSLTLHSFFDRSLILHPTFTLVHSFIHPSLIPHREPVPSRRGTWPATCRRAPELSHARHARLQLQVRGQVPCV